MSVFRKLDVWEFLDFTILWIRFQKLKNFAIEIERESMNLYTKLGTENGAIFAPTRADAKHVILNCPDFKTGRTP